MIATIRFAHRPSCPYYVLMQTRLKSTLLANTFGTLGYFSCLLLWVWVAILYLPLLFDNKQVKDFLIPTPVKAVPTPPLASPSPITLIFAIAVTIVVMAVTVIVLLRVPVTIARTGKTVTTKAASSIEPLVAHGRPLPPKEKRRLTVSLIKLVKLLLVIIPVIAGLLSAFVSLALPFEIVTLVSCLLACLSIFLFSAQYICASALHVAYDRLV